MSKLDKKEPQGEREKMNAYAHVLKIVLSQAQQELNKKILYLGESFEDEYAYKTYGGHNVIYPALEQAAKDFFV